MYISICLLKFPLNGMGHDRVFCSCSNVLLETCEDKTMWGLIEISVKSTIAAVGITHLIDFNSSLSANKGFNDKVDD